MRKKRSKKRNWLARLLSLPDSPFRTRVVPNKKKYNRRRDTTVDF